jgi:hypothetical protein
MEPTTEPPETEAEAEADIDPAAPVERDYVVDLDDVHDGDRKWVVARINTDAVDRYATVIDPLGIDRSFYQKNPVVLWEHGKDPARGRRPIGRNAWIKARPEKRDLIAKTVFADDEFSRGLFNLYRDGVLRGWSINGTPVASGPPTAAEVAARPELRSAKLVYRSLRLTEYSAVAVPGNPDALTEATSRGLWLPDLLKARLPASKLPPLVGRTLAQVVASVERQARELVGAEVARARADAIDLARGRI